LKILKFTVFAKKPSEILIKIEIDSFLINFSLHFFAIPVLFSHHILYSTVLFTDLG